MNKLLWGVAMLGLLCHSCSNSTSKNNQMEKNTDSNLLLFIGSYASEVEEGIKVYSFNQDSGQYAYLTGASGVSNPSFLAISSKKSLVYAVGEDEGDTATINVLNFDQEKMKLTLKCSEQTHGGAPCNVTLSPKEDFVLTANYFGGNVSVFSLEKDGLLTKKAPHILSFHGKSIHPERQTKSYLHSVRFTGDERYLIANDLGADRLYMYPVNSTNKKVGNEDGSLLDESKRKEVKIEAGAGPRHLCIHPNGIYYYLITELSGKVVAMRYANETLTPFQYIEADTVHAEGSADIHCTSDGNFLYASNRLKADGIAIFKVNKQNGNLTRIGYQLTGIHPRNFIITPNDRYLLVACRDDNEIQIYLRDKNSGLLTDTGERIKMMKPVCLKWAHR